MSKIGRVGSGGYGWDTVAARKSLFTAHSGRKRALVPRKLFCVPEQLGGGVTGWLDLSRSSLQTALTAAAHRPSRRYMGARLSRLVAHAAGGSVPLGPSGTQSLSGSEVAKSYCKPQLRFRARGNQSHVPPA